MCVFFVRPLGRWSIAVLLRKKSSEREISPSSIETPLHTHQRRHSRISSKIELFDPKMQITNRKGLHLPENTTNSSNNEMWNVRTVPVERVRLHVIVWSSICPARWWYIPHWSGIRRDGMGSLSMSDRDSIHRSLNQSIHYCRHSHQTNPIPPKQLSHQSHPQNDCNIKTVATQFNTQKWSNVVYHRSQWKLERENRRRWLLWIFECRFTMPVLACMAAYGLTCARATEKAIRTTCASNQHKRVETQHTQHTPFHRIVWVTWARRARGEETWIIKEMCFVLFGRKK